MHTCDFGRVCQLGKKLLPIERLKYYPKLKVELTQIILN